MTNQPGETHLNLLEKNNKKKLLIIGANHHRWMRYKTKTKQKNLNDEFRMCGRWYRKH